MDKATFLSSLEACYAQQETQEFSPVEVRGSDGVYYEYSYLINRVVRPLDSATVEAENIIKAQLGQETVSQAVIDEMKVREEAIVLAEAERLAEVNSQPHVSPVNEEQAQAQASAEEAQANANGSEVIY